MSEQKYPNRKKYCVIVNYEFEGYSVNFYTKTELEESFKKIYTDEKHFVGSYEKIHEKNLNVIIIEMNRVVLPKLDDNGKYELKL